jgi:hypothetical protein
LWPEISKSCNIKTIPAPFCRISSSNRPKHGGGALVNDARDGNGSSFFDMHGNNDLMRVNAK